MPPKGTESGFVPTQAPLDVDAAWGEDDRIIEQQKVGFEASAPLRLGNPSQESIDIMQNAATAAVRAGNISTIPSPTDRGVVPAEQIVVPEDIVNQQASEADLPPEARPIETYTMPEPVAEPKPWHDPSNLEGRTIVEPKSRPKFWEQT